MGIDPGLQTFCLLAGLAFSGVIVAALASRLRDVWLARHWPSTSGTVTRSQVRSHRQQASDGEHYESEPLVDYEYEVGGQHYRGSRISFAVQSGGSEVLPTLSRYPVGRTVRVYYDPAHPGRSVLERDMPRVVYLGVGILLCFFLGAALLFPLGLSGAVEALAPVLPHPERAPIVVMLGAMGLFTLWMWLAVQREVWAARSWSSTRGKVLVADLESFQDAEPDSHQRSTNLYRPSVVYSFEVNGQRFMSDRVTLGGTLSGSAAGRPPGFIAEETARYPVGSEVTVYYDAKDPTQSALERRGSGAVLLAASCAGLWALAALFALI